MKFTVDQNDKIGQGKLTYLVDEFSFNMEPIVYKIDIELIVNKLSLAVTDSQVVHVSGFCGYKEWIGTDKNVPKYVRGALKVEYDLKHGLAYGINDEDLPVYVNSKTGWVCVGNPERDGIAVEFINNCVAVIDDAGEFTSLWLRPPSLPR
ncbi:MAG: hypothetical protein OEW40_18290 [Cyclobacteriaceae bacterium]|nr:hypothetical protein [Cyclobacteriaceae bacterium]